VDAVPLTATALVVVKPIIEASSIMGGIFVTAIGPLSNFEKNLKDNSNRLALKLSPHFV
jgi:hypothetical protein